MRLVLYLIFRLAHSQEPGEPLKFHLFPVLMQSFLTNLTIRLMQLIGFFVLLAFISAVNPELERGSLGPSRLQFRRHQHATHRVF